jgi:hypothetical protein
MGGTGRPAPYLTRAEAQLLFERKAPESPAEVISDLKTHSRGAFSQETRLPQTQRIAQWPSLGHGEEVGDVLGCAAPMNRSGREATRR